MRQLNLRRPYERTLAHREPQCHCATGTVLFIFAQHSLSFGTVIDWIMWHRVMKQASFLKIAMQQARLHL
jgi:hypothetical protein